MEGKGEKEEKEVENSGGGWGTHGQEMLFPKMFPVIHLFQLNPISYFSLPLGNATVLWICQKINPLIKPKPYDLLFLQMLSLHSQRGVFFNFLSVSWANTFDNADYQSEAIPFPLSDIRRMWFIELMFNWTKFVLYYVNNLYLIQHSIATVITLKRKYKILDDFYSFPFDFCTVLFIYFIYLYIFFLYAIRITWWW